MTSDHDELVDRERRFHDSRFTGHDEKRARAAKYYAIDTGKKAYRDAVFSSAPGADVLEYGCGAGSYAIPLSRRGATVTGVDISPIAVRRARRRAKRKNQDVRFAVMDAHDLRLPDASVDVVCGTGILHHLDLALALPEVARVLRPDGVAVFYEPLGTNPLINVYRRLTPSMRTPDEHPLLPSDFALAGRHFAEIERDEHTFLALAGAVLRRLGPMQRLVPTLQRADGWLFDHVPWTRRLAWVVVVRLRRPKAG